MKSPMNLIDNNLDAIVEEIIKQKMKIHSGLRKNWRKRKIKKIYDNN